MNTTEIVVILARKLGISQAAARTLLRERLNGFGRILVEQKALDLPGLGRIEVQKIKERRQYIPGKDSICVVPSHKRPVFKINKLFRARLRKDGS